MASPTESSKAPAIIADTQSDLSKEIIINRDGMVRAGSAPSKEAETGATYVADVLDNMDKFIASQEFSPEMTKTFKRQFSVKQAAEMAGRSTSSIRHNEKLGNLPEPKRLPETNRRAPYSLEQVNGMRDHYGTRPGRAEDEVPAVIAFQNFKGGCGKSTLAVHGAQALALKGYRVLLVDCDPQGSSSDMFGLNPELRAFFNPEQAGQSTLSDYLHRDVSRFSDLIVPSYFPGVDVVPTSLELFDAEYAIAAAMHETPDVVELLRNGIRSVWDDYDFVILDPPPALGMLSISVFYAANAMITPTRPTRTDVVSTRTFYRMFAANVATLRKNGYPIDYNFHLLLINAFNESRSAEVEMRQALEHALPKEHRCETVMRESAEITSAAKQIQTVYELTGPISNYKTYQRCVGYMDKLFTEIETRARMTWPSNRESLRQEHVI